jgi:hypothetical protein
VRDFIILTIHRVSLLFGAIRLKRAQRDDVIRRKSAPSPEAACQRLHVGQPVSRSPQWSISTKGWSHCLQRFDGIINNRMQNGTHGSNHQARVEVEGDGTSSRCRHNFPADLPKAKPISWGWSRLMFEATKVPASLRLIFSSVHGA